MHSLDDMILLFETMKGRADNQGHLTVSRVLLKEVVGVSDKELEKMLGEMEAKRRLIFKKGLSMFFVSFNIEHENWIEAQKETSRK